MNILTKIINAFNTLSDLQRGIILVSLPIIALLSLVLALGGFKALLAVFATLIALGLMFLLLKCLIAGIMLVEDHLKRVEDEEDS